MPLRLDLPGDTPPLFYRRASSLRVLKRAHSGRPQLPRAFSVTTVEPQDRSTELTARPALANSPPKVPIELLDRIVQLYVQGVVAKTGMKRSQKNFFKKYIKDYTLVSKDFRSLILRHFFNRLFFASKDDSKDLLDYLTTVDVQYRKQVSTFTGYSWTRSLCSPSFLIAANEKYLSRFTHVEDLHVDFMHSNIMLQRACSERLFKTLSVYTLARNLTSLMLTALPRIDVHILQSIAEIMPMLANLHVSSTDALDLDCCPECYEESYTRIIHSPVPSQYPHPYALANAFGPALAPLKHLTSLFLGIFLSRPDLLDLHASHDHNVNAGSRPVDSTFDYTFESIYECPQCENFARVSTKQDELLASLVLAQHVKSLRNIGWSSCFMLNLADGQLGKDYENYLEGDSSPNDALKVSFRRPKGLTWNEQDHQAALTNSFTSRTVFGVDRNAQKVRIIRLM